MASARGRRPEPLAPRVVRAQKAIKTSGLTSVGVRGKDSCVVLEGGSYVKRSQEYPQAFSDISEKALSETLEELNLPFALSPFQVRFYTSLFTFTCC